MKTARLLLLMLVVELIPFCGKAQIITTIAGNGTGGYTGDYGPATNAQILYPVGVAKDNAGNLYFSERSNSTIRKISTASVINTYAGNGTTGSSGDGGPATLAQLNLAAGIAIDKHGNLYVATAGSRVRKIDPSGTISTFAGDGSATISGDGGPATAAGLGNATTVCTDTSGNVFIAGGYCIRKVNTSGIITTIAGTGMSGSSPDGSSADTAKIPAIDQVFVDIYGNIYFTDWLKHAIRKIATDGILTTVAGSGTAGYTGDGGPATLARLNTPTGVLVDSCGYIYISEKGNSTIRVVNGEGKIFTLAGTNTAGYSGDGGAATAAQVNWPFNLLLDDNHDLIFADLMNNRIRKIALPRCDSMVFPSAVTDVAAGEQAMHIFPNPTDGDFSVKINTGSTTPIQLSIVTIVGAVVRQYTILPGKDTPLHPMLPPGIYLLVANVPDGRLVSKVVVR